MISLLINGRCIINEMTVTNWLTEYRIFGFRGGSFFGKGLGEEEL